MQPALRAIAIREMRGRGLPKPRAQRVLFTVWGVPASSWFLVAADYTNVSGSVASIVPFQRPELVLEGDAYEDHWLEVVRIGDGSVKTIFSGLGYSL